MGLMRKQYKLLHLLTGKWFTKNTYVETNYSCRYLLPIFTNEPYVLPKLELEDVIRNSIKIGKILIQDEGMCIVSCYNEFEIIEVDNEEI